MNVNMIRHKIETEDLVLSITKKCETLFKQTHARLQETLEYNLSQSKQTFQFNPPISINGSWMI